MENIECKTCNGSGLVTTYNGEDKHEHKCPSCSGLGTIILLSENVEAVGELKDILDLISKLYKLTFTVSPSGYLLLQDDRGSLTSILPQRYNLLESMTKGNEQWQELAAKLNLAIRPVLDEAAKGLIKDFVDKANSLKSKISD